MAERITGTPDEPWSVERLGAAVAPRDRLAAAQAVALELRVRSAGRGLLAVEEQEHDGRS